MANTTGIEWTDVTVNPFPGCCKVSEGCVNCYAERMARRLKAMGVPAYQDVVDDHGWTGRVGWNPDAMRVPGKGKTVFVNSMGDLFYEGVTDDQRDWAFACMVAQSEHRWQILTKRSLAAANYFRESPCRIIALVYNAMYEQRNDFAQNGDDGRVGNRLERKSVATQETPREGCETWRRLLYRLMHQSVPASSSGMATAKQLPHAFRNFPGGKNGGDGASGSLDQYTRTNTAGTDDQSQKRCENRQSTKQSRIGNDVRAAATCGICSECEPQLPQGQQTSQDASRRGRCYRDTKTPCRRPHGEKDRRDVQNETQGNFCDLPPEDVASHLTWPPRNIWLGVTAENQRRADERIPILLQIPAAVRFVSLEPLLSPVSFHTPFMYEHVFGGSGRLRHMLDWVIVGSESGPKRRECQQYWIVDIVKQCHVAGVPVFVKQINDSGEVVHDPERIAAYLGWRVEDIRQWPASSGLRQRMARCPKISERIF